VRLVSSNLESVRRNAALALGAYSLNNKDVQNEVNRAIPTLVGILENLVSQATTLKTVAACLSSLADGNKPNQQVILQNGGLKAAVQLFYVDGHIFVRSCLNLISAVVSHNEVAQNTVMLEHPRLVPDLLTLLSAPDLVNYRDTITNTLVELSKRNKQIQSMIYHLDGIDKLAPLLEGYEYEQDSSKTHIQANIVFLLFTLVRLKNYSVKVRTLLTKLGVVEFIRPMCAAKSRHLTEVSLNLMKAIESK